MIYLYLLTCAVCLALVYRFRHNLADNRGQLLIVCIAACVPVVNVVVPAWVWYYVVASERVIEWLKQPLERKP